MVVAGLGEEEEEEEDVEAAVSEDCAEKRDPKVAAACYHHREAGILLHLSIPLVVATAASKDEGEVEGGEYCYYACCKCMYSPYCLRLQYAAHRST